LQGRIANGLICQKVEYIAYATCFASPVQFSESTTGARNRSESPVLDIKKA